jgi:Mg2+ and Co2+ transporter CorA
MTIHKCVLCDYETKQSCNYSRHIKSVKHLNFVEKAKKINDSISKDTVKINLSDNKTNDEILDIIVNKIVNIINDRLDKIEKKMDSMEYKIEKKMDSMEYKIIKEQRKTTSNLMTILNFDKEYLEIAN